MEKFLHCFQYMNSRTASSIRNNHRSGAARLTSDALTVLSELIQNDTSTSAEKFFQNITEWCTQLKNAQPFMASIRTETYSFIKTAENYIQTTNEITAIRPLLLDWLKQRQLERRQNLRQLGSFGSSIIETNDTIMTYSASSTISAIIMEAHQQTIPFSVILSEARPIKEGVALAKRLAKQGIPTTLVVDILLPHYLPTVQKLIIGADWISETQFTNKIGTGLLVDLALKQQIPVSVAATMDKIYPQRYYPLTIDDQPPEEITKSHIPPLTIKNRYFEEIPHSDKITFITEQGILKLENILQKTRNELL
jgi:translation initiation factor 2B subunit (eIF-2B alpha/beta/delta family)